MRCRAKITLSLSLAFFSEALYFCSKVRFSRSVTIQRLVRRSNKIKFELDSLERM